MAQRHTKEGMVNHFIYIFKKYKFKSYYQNDSMTLHPSGEWRSPRLLCSRRAQGYRFINHTLLFLFYIYVYSYPIHYHLGRVLGMRCFIITAIRVKGNCIRYYDNILNLFLYIMRKLQLTICYIKGTDSVIKDENVCRII